MNSNSFKGRIETKTIKTQKSSVATMNHISNKSSKATPPKQIKNLPGLKLNHKRRALTWIVIRSCTIYSVALALTYTKK